MLSYALLVAIKSSIFVDFLDIQVSPNLFSDHFVNINDNTFHNCKVNQYIATVAFADTVYRLKHQRTGIILYRKIQKVFSGRLILFKGDYNYGRRKPSSFQCCTSRETLDLSSEVKRVLQRFDSPVGFRSNLEKGRLCITEQFVQTILMNPSELERCCEENSIQKIDQCKT